MMFLGDKELRQTAGGNDKTPAKSWGGRDRSWARQTDDTAREMHALLERPDSLLT